MITNRLRNIFALSISVFILHGLEEYYTNFYDMDIFFKIALGPLLTMPTAQATFLLLQIMFWLILIISLLILANNKWHAKLMIIPGLIYIFETHHIIKAIIVSGYYPGLITTFAFPVIAYFFWKELLPILKK
jgi:hypothetical protein